ncbi:hypothetical protein D3C85_1425920 [compost metagenome]
MRDEVPGRPVDALDVDRVDAVELVFGDLQDRLVAMGGAGVVDHDVHVAEGGQRGVPHGGHVVAPRHVGPDRAGGATCRAMLFADRGGDALGGLQVQVGHHHGGAFARERMGDAFAEARAAARDHGHLASQSCHVLSPI